MTERARTMRLAAMGIAAVALTACETPLGPADVSSDNLSGQWIACLNDGAGDYGRSMNFYPDSYAAITRTYATTDRTCAGAETGSSTEIWRYVLTGTATARIGPSGTEVLARQLTVENSFVTLYTLVYVDEQSVPPVLYLGDLALDPLKDGTSPEKRPEVLSATTALTSR
jgi:hypothetical protein